MTTLAEAALTTCEICGDEVAQPGLGPRRKYCDRCSGRRLEIRDEVTPGLCGTCGKQLPAPRPGRGRPRKYCDDRCRRARWSKTMLGVRGDCVGCGTELPVGASRYCSTCAADARRDRTQRSRCADWADADPVWFTKIADRDGWMCHVCGAAVSRDAAFPDPMSGTIDHIIPLASGGEHSAANVKLAHSRCNMERGCSEHAPSVARRLS